MILPWASERMESPTPKNLADILIDRARSSPGRVYLYSQQGPVSYVQVEKLAGHLARHLTRNTRFLEPPVLAACVKDAGQLFYLIWACLIAGIGLAFLPQIRDRLQIRRLMEQVGALNLVTDMPELLAESYSLPSKTLIQSATGLNGALDCAAVGAGFSPDQPAFIFQTSGTTGEAKWVAVYQDQFLKAIDCLERVGNLEHARNQVTYLTPPLSHSYGLSSLLEYTWAGSSLVLPRGCSPFGPAGELQGPMMARQITAIEGVPYFYTQLARLLGRLKLPALKHIGLGGGRPEPLVMNRLLAANPQLICSVRYGLTETPSVVSHKLFLPPHIEQADYWHSSGKILPIYELRLIDEAGRIVTKPGQEGEIHLKGDCLAWPYYGQTEVDGSFFATGDLGYIDHNRELVIAGRKSLYLKNQGFRFSPEYIEAILNTCTGVSDCRLSMANGKLVVEVARSDPVLSQADLMSFLSHKLPRYAVPEAIYFIESIPRTNSGKIKRI